MRAIVRGDFFWKSIGYPVSDNEAEIPAGTIVRWVVVMLLESLIDGWKELEAAR